jgi:hypothetical protein
MEFHNNANICYQFQSTRKIYKYLIRIILYGFTQISNFLFETFLELFG